MSHVVEHRVNIPVGESHSHVVTKTLDLLSSASMGEVAALLMDFAPDGAMGHVGDHEVAFIPNFSTGPGDDHFGLVTNPWAMSHAADHEIDIFTILPGGGPLDDHFALGIPPEIIPLDPDVEAEPPPPRIPPATGTVIYLSPNVYGSEANTSGRRDGPKGVL